MVVVVVVRDNVDQWWETGVLLRTTVFGKYNIISIYICIYIEDVQFLNVIFIYDYGTA